MEEKLETLPDGLANFCKTMRQLAIELLAQKLYNANEIEVQLGKSIALYMEIYKDNQNARKYMNCIDHLLDMWQTVQQKIVEKPYLDSTEAVKILVNLIKSTFLEGTRTVQQDCDLSLAFVHYCIKENDKLSLIDFFTNALLADLRNEQLWKLIKKVYFHETNKVKTFIWDIMVDVCKKVVTHILKEDESIRMKKLFDFFHAAFENIRCSYFHISILDSIEDDNITKQVEEEFKHDPYMWNALAQKLWRVDVQEVEAGTPDTSKDTRERLVDCIGKYKEGLAFLEHKNKSTLWCFFIDFMFLVHDSKDIKLSPDYKDILIKLYMEEGISYLGEHQVMKWIKVENREDTKQLEVLNFATSILPGSAKIWSERLNFECCNGDYSSTRLVFDDAVAHVKKDALVLWEEMVQYTILNSDKTTVEELFWEASHQCVQVSSQMRPLYLEWLMVHNEIVKARKIFERLVETEPHSLEMYVQMCKIETMMAIDFDLELTEKTFMTAMKKYPLEVDLRIDYLRFLFNITIRNHKYADKITAVVNECQATFPPHLLVDFNKKYAAVRKLHS